jgi:hypothetical protein
MSLISPSNINTPELGVSQPTTQEFFNNFFTKQYEISPDANDAVVAFFETITDNRESAQALSASVIYTALTQETDPMSLLQQFASLPRGELDAYLAMFLNLNRIPSSLLGVTNTPITNKYVARTFLP